LETDWNAIVRDHGPAVFRCAWRILGKVADAEDVTQDVLMDAYRLNRRQPVNNWPALLQRLAACRALDRIRRRRPTLSINGLSLAASHTGSESDLIAAELADRLPEAIARLPEREGEVFCLRYFEDLSNPQIAEALDMQLGAVAAALHKARAKLQTLLQPPVEKKKNAR
jgi:RNA polymerase sigma-70 factor, ECF subfamily